MRGGVARSSGSHGTYEATAVRVGGKHRGHQRQAVFGVVLLTPAFVYFAMWVFLPLLYGLYLSFTNSTLLNTPKVIGFSNYRMLWHNPIWWSSLVRTLEYAAEVVIPTLVLAFIMARLAIHCGRGRSLLMTIYFLPYVVPGVVAALVFESIFQPYGLVNTVLHLHIAWLSDPKVTMYAMSLATIWSLVGYYVIIFMAGFQQLPAELTEAARLDGASTLQLVRRVEVPLLRPIVLFSAITAVAFVLTNFGTPFVMTDGGPANATMILPLLIYQETFVYSSAGVGAAMAVVLMLLSLVLTAAMLWIIFIRGRRVGTVART